MGKAVTVEELVSMKPNESAAKELSRQINQHIETLAPVECWRRISKEILRAHHPFELHWFLYQRVYCDRDSSQGPPPAWIPDEEFISKTNIAVLMKELKLDTYEELHAWSVKHRGRFWEALIKKLGIRFKRAYSKVLDLSLGQASPRWLIDAKLNIADSCFNAPIDWPAIVYQQEGGVLSSVTYGELESLVNRVANALTSAGFIPADAMASAAPIITSPTPPLHPP